MPLQHQAHVLAKRELFGCASFHHSLPRARESSSQCRSSEELQIHANANVMDQEDIFLYAVIMAYPSARNLYGRLSKRGKGA